MNKKEFKTRIYDIYSKEYADYKVANTFNELKDYLQNKKSYREFVDMLEGVYEDFYDISLEHSESMLEDVLKDLYENTISNNKENIDVQFVSNGDAFDFIVNGVSFFDKDFINEVEKL